MEERIYSIWCEYDIGQEWVLFRTKESAKKYINENSQDCPEGYRSYKLLKRSGLLTIEEKTLIG